MSLAARLKCARIRSDTALWNSRQGCAHVLASSQLMPSTPHMATSTHDMTAMVPSSPAARKSDSETANMSRIDWSQRREVIISPALLMRSVKLS